MKVLVTGATGFVGAALCARLALEGWAVVPALRKPCGLPGEVVIGALEAGPGWLPALAGCSAVVHLAARVHVPADATRDALALYRAANTDATLRLAREAALAGVRRFVFVSSIKVNGEGSDKPYRETDVAAPQDAYALSKWEAEQGLWQIAQESGLEVVILRPPLVYGPGVKANFLNLMRAVDRRLPLPFGAIRNRRSLLYLGNLVDVIRLCLTHPNAAGKTLLVCDGEDISTPELVRRIAAALGRRPRLLPVPVSWMRFAGGMLGKREAVERLLGSLTVDSTQVRAELGWQPPYSMQAGLAATAQWYRQIEAR